jgi:transposase
MAKKYCVDLVDEERDYLLKFIKSGEHSARKINRARILLLADEGKTDPEIVEALHTSCPTVQRIRKRFVEEGLHNALNERPRIGGRLRKKLDEKGLAVLETLARSKPPAGRKRWTLQLLADRLVELQIVDSISDETVRQACKKRGLSLG